MKTFRKLKWDFSRFGITPKNLFRRMFPEKIPVLWVNSLPKSGTHLIERLLCLHPQLYRPLINTINNENLARYGGIHNLLKTAKGGQIFVSHLAWKDEYLTPFEQFNVRRIMLVRDPRAIIPSNINYILSRQDHFRHADFLKVESFDARVRLMLHGDSQLGISSYREILQSFLEWNKHAYVVRFEDIVGSKGGGNNDVQLTTGCEIFSQCGVNNDIELVKQIATSAHSDLSPTFKKGSIDGWRKILSPEILSEINVTLAAELRELNYQI